MRGSLTPANNTGSNNTVVGAYALSGYTSGTSNTVLGSHAGYNVTTGSANILIGNGAGGTTNVNNKLFIANSGTDNPLIKGDFSTGEVKINSQLRVGGSGDAASATLQVDGNYAISGKTTFTGSQNNYNLGGKSVIHVNGGGSYTLTGIAGGVDGLVVHIYVSTTTDLILADANVGSILGNRIITGDNANLTISQGGGATLIYDGDVNYWRVIGVKN
jgi:hypothetical protein